MRFMITKKESKAARRTVILSACKEALKPGQLSIRELSAIVKVPPKSLSMMLQYHRNQFVWKHGYWMLA